MGTEEEQTIVIIKPEGAEFYDNIVNKIEKLEDVNFKSQQSYHGEELKCFKNLEDFTEQKDYEGKTVYIIRYGGDNVVEKVKALCESSFNKDHVYCSPDEDAAKTDILNWFG